MSTKLLFYKWLFLSLATASLLLGGATGNVVAAGYGLPVGITASPGQVITVLVAGLHAPPAAVSSPSTTWPTTLGGITVTLNAMTETGMTTLAVPLSAVFPFSNCSQLQPSPCGVLTGVTLQIPFEMLGPPPGRLTPPFSGALTISDQSSNAATVTVFQTSDQIHVLRSLDTVLGGQVGGGIPAVTHVDGTPVSNTSPAKAGETLVMYAVGLGVTSPPAATGAPSPASPLSQALPQTFGIRYDFEPNAASSIGVRSTPASVPAPLFVGLTPGYVGLYQVNFSVPTPPSGTPACGSGVNSNLTVTLTGPASFDGAAICVDVSELSLQKNS
jgi:uncharacterized protein (TIGR03437 family)